MSEKKISPGTLSDMVLTFLASSGSVSKKALHAPFVGKFAASYYSRTYQRLLSRKLIKEEKVVGRIEVRLTNEGVALVKEMHPEKEVIRPPSQDSDYMKKRRQRMFSNTNAVFAASNIVVAGAAKPDIVCFREGENDYSLMQKMDRASSRGVFYSSKELKRICKSTDGSSEYLYSSRLLGIIILNWNIIYVYNTGDKLIEIYPKREAKTIRAIENVLTGTPYIRDKIKVGKKKDCILIGGTKSMLVKVFRGNAYGKRTQETQKFKQSQMARWKAVHASLEMFKQLFDKIYFLSADVNGSKMLDEIKTLYEDIPGTLYDDLAHVLGCSIDGTCAHMAFNHETAQLVIPMPIIEFREIEQYNHELKTNRQTATVYGPKYYADTISRCLGSSIDEFYDSNTGERVPIFHYDDNGYPVGETYMRGLIPVKEKIDEV